jgi:PAS domain S-box-containing protein
VLDQPLSAHLALFEASRAPMLLVDRETGRIVEANAAAARFYGYTHEVLRGLPITTLNVSSPDHIRTAMALAEAGGAEFDFLHRLASGEIRPVVVSSSPVQLGGRALLFSIVRPRDATAPVGSMELDAAQLGPTAVESRLQDLLDGSPGGIVTVGPDRRFSYANAAACELFGQDLATLLTLGPFDVVPPEDHDTLAKDLDRAAAGASLVSEYRFVRLDGAVRWAGVSQRGQSDGTVRAIVRDITDVKHHEVALRASEGRFRALYEHAPLGVAIQDMTSGRTYRANDRLLAIIGREGTPAEAIDWLTVTDTEDGARERALAARLATGEIATYSLEKRVLRPDGSVRWVSKHVAPLAAAEAGQHLCVAMVLDITDVKLAAATAGRIGAELAEAQRLAHLGSWTWLSARRVFTGSPELFAIHGVGQPDVPTPIEDLLRGSGPETQRLVLAMIRQILATGDSTELEYEARRPDGSVRQVLSHAEALDDGDGNRIGVRGTSLDVTDLREAQARADIAQRTEMVARLAAGVAHDFNNLLAAIGGFALFLGEAIPPGDPRHADVDGIRVATARAAGLTRQLLAFGRHQALVPAIVDVDDIVRTIDPVLRSLAGGVVALRIRPAPEAATVYVDRAQLEQAIVNLVLSAREATPPGGVITVETAHESVAADEPGRRATAPPGPYVRLSVTDTGAGLDADQVSHVFEPFFTTGRFGQGNGMGLSSVDGAIRQSGGFTSATSTPGAGTTISIHLPYAGSPVPSAASTATPADGDTADAPGSILVVDDEPVVRAILARLLRGLGLTVIEAEGPPAALAVARSEDVQLQAIVSDVVMPGLDGPELVRQVRLIRPALPAVFVSAYSPEAVFAGGQLPDQSAFVAKPFTREDLVRALDLVGVRTSSLRP